MSITVSPSLNRLIEEFSKLPGIGPKTAQRLAFYLLNMDKREILNLIDSIKDASEKIGRCNICQNLTEDNPCPICSEESRDPLLICVVEEPRDVLAMERSREFKGKYHVLHGAISPIDGVGPEDIKIPELIKRLKENKADEVIIAMDSNIEGETTTMYLAGIIKPMGIKVSRLAYGLPVGGDLEYADEMTLARAFEGRREI